MKPTPDLAPPLPNWIADQLELNAPADENSVLPLGDPSWTDYDFSCQAWRDREKGNFALVVRLQAQVPSAYIAQFGIGELGSFLYRWMGGPLYKLGEGQGGLKAGTWHKLTVKVRGNKIECFVDGTKVIEATDDKYPTGGIGLRGGVGIRFKEVRVTDADGKELMRGVPPLKIPE